MEDDSNKYAKEYKKLVSIGELLPNDIKTGLQILCYQTAGIDGMEKMYKKKDIVKIWELYSVKLACEYQNPYKERIDG